MGLHRVWPMPSKPKDARKTITVRIDAALVLEARAFVHDYSGKPLYLTLNGLVEQALRREIDRLGLVLAGALPLDRAAGSDVPGDEPPGGGRAEPARRPVNANKH